MSTIQLLCTVFLVHVCSALASEKDSFSIQGNEKATACGLDDFQIDTLSKASYWSVPFTSEHLDKCIIPDSYERHQVSSCQIHFSVCRSIPEGVCEGHPNSTACQEVVTEDGLRHYYSIGKSQEGYQFKPNGYPSTDGFFTVRHGHAISHHRSMSCRGPFKISLKFVCDRDGVWDPLSHDTSRHVRVIVVVDHCHLEIEFGYSGACQRPAPTLAPAMSNCSLSPYNLTGLTRHEYWFAHVPKLCNEDGDPSVRDCTVYFAFCQKLPTVVDDRIKLGPNCSGAAVCLTFLEERFWPHPKVVSYSMGQFNNFTGFSYNTELAGGGFNMDVGNGSRIHKQHGTCSLRTRIVLTCNSSATWSDHDLTSVFSYRVENDNPCEYTLILPYSGACLPVFPNATVLPSTVHPTMTTPSKINTTSVHPHPTTTIRPPPPSSSQHHTTNSTTTNHPSPTPSRNSTAIPTSSHPSPTPTRNSTTMTRTSTVPTSSHHPSTTKKHPSSAPATATMTHTLSSRHATGTSTAAFSPTAAPHEVTTNATPVDPDRRVILGLIAGIAVFAVLSIVLLAMVIISVRVLLKKRHKLKFVKLDS